MKSFKLFESVRQKNHYDHLEDIVLYDGKAGLAETQKLFGKLIQKLQEGNDNNLFISSKMDGSPMITAGYNPENNKFFVATKSLYNKIPKLNYTTADVIKNHPDSADLQSKLDIALHYLPLVIPKGKLYQADLMFTKTDLKERNIGKRSYVSFQPNALMYAIPSESDVAKKVWKADIGIAIHTELVGTTIKDLKSRPLPKPKYIQNPKVYVFTTGIDIAKDTYPPEQIAKAVRLNAIIKQKAAKLSANIIDFLVKNEANINKFNNLVVRMADKSPASEQAKNLLDYISRTFDQKIDSLKQDKSKEKYQNKKSNVLSGSSIDDMTLYYEYVDSVKALKLHLISMFDKISDINTFIHANSEYKPTNGEGFVLVDDSIASGQTIAKMIDRDNFSYINFNLEKRGWNKKDV